MRHIIEKQNHSLPFLIATVSLMAALFAPADEPSSKPTPARPPQQQEVLNNAAIIDLKGLGLGENVIVDKIKTSRCDFDVSIDGLKQLKAAAVPDVVISAMLAAKPGAAANGAVVIEPPPTQTIPNRLTKAGIWLCAEQFGKIKMKKLEPSVYSQAKSGAGLFMQFGATMKTKASFAVLMLKRKP